MNAVVQLSPAPSQVPAPDLDALYAAYLAQATALPKGSVSGADALLAAVVQSALSPSTFKPLAATIAKATGLDAKVLVDEMSDARKALTGPVLSAAAQAPSGMANPDPAPSPDTLEKVMDIMARAITRQVVCSAHAVVAAVLWAAGTYGFRGATIYPRLMITSPVKRCGKSTLLGTLHALVSRPLKADNVSPSAIFRVIGENPPTLLIDEADTFLKRNEELRGIVNAGYERSGNVLRCVATPDGKGIMVAKFPVFAPLLVAGIGEQRDTVMDRSVIIPLSRAEARGAGQRQAPMRHRDLEKLRTLMAPHLVAHASVIEAAMAAGMRTLPRGLPDRAQDNWEPLLAVADLAGGTWPLRARTAALALSGGHDTPSQRETLLADLGEIVRGARAQAHTACKVWRRLGAKRGPRPDDSRADYVRTGDLMRELLAMEHRPWAEMDNGRPLSPTRLASMLRPFGIAPQQKKVPIVTPHRLGIAPTENVRVYSTRALRAVCARYG